MKKTVLFLAGALSALPMMAADQLPAFPGAEGFGRYTTGGRGGKVYHVTSLDDDASQPAKGTFRYACNQNEARTIVFDVAGTIHLKGSLKIKGNVTIAGQTAPGDGICLADWPVTVGGSNVIIRYLRFRVGNKNVASHEGDGFGSMDNDNIMIDHCSISWSVDECCSVYGGHNMTVQWSIISQSMRNCGHSKGTHGYGGNWGGAGCTYAHNLLCHHESRTPRLGPRQSTQTDERMDMRNNVIYNWAGNGCYGGEGMDVNIVNNYYKPGPATLKKSKSLQERIAAPGIRTTSYCQNSDGTWNGWYPMWHHWGQFFVDGNYVEGSTRCTDDNWTYGIYNQINNSTVDNTFTAVTRDTMHLDAPINFLYTTNFTPQVAFEKVLDYAGCIKVRSGKLVRDHIDSTMVNDTRYGKATYGNSGNLPGLIDSQDDCIPAGATSAWPELTATASETSRASQDSDGDGIPDYYEDTYFGGDVDGKAYRADGYTNLEYYMNTLLLNAKITKPCTSDGEVLGQEVDKYVTGLEIVPTEEDTPLRPVNVYDLCGNPIKLNVTAAEAKKDLVPGYYIIDQKKVCIQ